MTEHVGNVASELPSTLDIVVCLIVNRLNIVGPAMGVGRNTT
jgi:hypothetical protein